MTQKNEVPSKTEEALLVLARDFLRELESDRALRALSIDASIEKDLGIGSLERAELFHRIEQTFVVQLNDNVIAQTESLREVARAIEDANPPGRILYHDFFPKPEKSGVDPSQCETLIDVLKLYAMNEPSRIHIYLQDEDGKETTIRYGRLYEAAMLTARGLQAYALNPKETVAIMLPTGEQFFYAFFGILLAGGIPVPIYPPFRSDRIEEYAKREAKILHNAQVKILISFSRVQTLNNILKNFIPSLKAVVTVEHLIEKGSTTDFTEVSVRTKDSALIQYTSGSTGDPKGVLLAHENLLANITAVAQAIQMKPTDVGVSWLPLYHDMGLIGAWLVPLYFGIPVTIMSPISFLNHPERWLWSIHYHRATVSAGPNFAYELCVSKIDDRVIEGLDLSCWRLAFNGAEAIHPKTIKKFIKRFSAYGFRPESFFPVYGLAESTVALTFPPINRPVRIDKIFRDKFNSEQIAEPCETQDVNCIEMVSCGVPLPGHEVRIVNEGGEEQPERVVGNVQFRGPSAMKGYYRNEQATQAIQDGSWLNSGDLAYKADGEFFITGRKKDIIVKAGRNLYPHEIEEVTGQVRGIRKGCVVAFGLSNPRSGTEVLVVVAETRERISSQQERITHDVVESLTNAIGEPPDHVILVPPKTIPKTSSGKLQRSACKNLYIQGKLAHRATPAWMQIAKLFLLSEWKKSKKALRVTGRFIYSLYGYFMIFATLIPTWLVMWLLPQKQARTLVYFWSRSVFRLILCPVHVRRKNHNQVSKAVIFVSNHMSYLDALVLVAFLPKDICIIGKRELLRVPIVNGFIKKLGHRTVERADFLESLSDTNNIMTELRQGRSLLIFPEGTFSYATGLRPFKLGAFKLATETHSTLCPIAIQGTRRVLRSGSLLLRPSRIYIKIGRPLTPRSGDWREAIRLRALIRKEIARNCGEQIIDIVSTTPPKL